MEVSERNKARYTANTSRGRVGRGGNARFHMFKLEHNGPMEGLTDKASYRVACPRLKRKFYTAQKWPNVNFALTK